jgi:PAS domain S-box-containing protein
MNANQMSRAEILYLLPYVASLAISLGVLYYTWKRREARGAAAFGSYVAGRTLWIFGFILELLSPDISGKMFWDGFQWLAASIEVVAFPVFAAQFTEHKFKHPQRLFALSLVVPSLFTLALMTDSLHHLLYPSPHLSQSFPFPELLYDFTWVVYGYVLYFYATVVWVIGLLARHLFRPHSLYRAQIAIILFGFLIPTIGTVFSLLGIQIAPERDATPFTGAVANLIIAWGLFRYQLFNIIPIAREKVFENMNDPVIVLDALNRVVDINQAALESIGKRGSEVIGLPADIAFAEWGELVRLLKDVGKERSEITVKIRGEPRNYELSVAPLRDRQDRLTGRIFIAHDITRRKNLEDGYRRLSEELEERVRERTEELRKSAERYRAVVENQSEFIVRWKPDGTRTFVNDAYYRYFGITPEQAISTSFVPLVVEEDRLAIEEKIVRLTTGVADSETEIHRVIRPDGSIGWQEWTDQSIRDEAGNIIEFQSIGRDITERKQAEEALRKSEEKFAKAFRSSPTIITITQLNNGKILEVNEAFEKIMGYTREEALGKTTVQLDIWRSQTDRDDFMRAFYANSQLKNAEVQFRTKGGNYITCLYSAELIELDGEKCLLSVIEDITERKRAGEALAEAYDTTLEGWAKALELRDKETEGHSRRVTETTLIVARAMGFNEEALIHIRRGSILHDIGKMGIPDDILRKEGPLTAEERQIVLKHPDTAYNLLKQISYLEKALEIPYCHHEKWDGTGYPRGLKGEAIPLSARIFAVVDVWDALSSDRPYRSTWPREKIEQYLISESATHFDPHVVTIFLKMVEKGEI